MRKKKRFLSNEEKDEMARLYIEGVKCIEIAKKFNSDPSWVSHIIKNRGINKPKIERYKFFTFQGDEDLIFRLRSLMEEGCDVPSAQKELGLTKAVILRLMRDNGIKRNSVSSTKRQYYLDESWVDKINSPEKAIFLGLFFADGCNLTSSHECTICLHLKDQEYLKKIVSLFTNKPLSKMSNRDMRRIQINSKNWSEKLSKHGGVPRKSLTLKWPNDLPKELTPYFIRGYFEGDGCIHSRSNKNTPDWFQVSIVGTFEFLTSLNKELDFHLGFQGAIYSKNTNNNTYSLVISKQKYIYEFGKWIYSDLLEFAMPRKLEKFQNQERLRFS
jgi:transposase-like protein